MSDKGNKSSKIKLAMLYGQRCLLTNMKTKKLQFHHLSKKEWGGQATVENGVNLATIPHAWLHSLESDEFELFMDLNICMASYKNCIDEGLTELVEEYETEIMPKIRERIKRYDKRRT